MQWLYVPSVPEYARPAWQVRGPARSSKEARKQQAKYAAAKEARSMLGEFLAQLLEPCPPVGCTVLRWLSHGLSLPSQPVVELQG